MSDRDIRNPLMGLVKAVKAKMSGEPLDSSSKFTSRLNSTYDALSNSGEKVNAARLFASTIALVARDKAKASQNIAAPKQAVQTESTPTVSTPTAGIKGYGGRAAYEAAMLDQGIEPSLRKRQEVQGYAEGGMVDSDKQPIKAQAPQENAFKTPTIDNQRIDIQTTPIRQTISLRGTDMAGMQVRNPIIPIKPTKI